MCDNFCNGKIVTCLCKTFSHNWASQDLKKKHSYPVDEHTKCPSGVYTNLSCSENFPPRIILPLPHSQTVNKRAPRPTSRFQQHSALNLSRRRFAKSHNRARLQNIGEFPPYSPLTTSRTCPAASTAPLLAALLARSGALPPLLDSRLPGGLRGAIPAHEHGDVSPATCRSPQTKHISPHHDKALVRLNNGVVAAWKVRISWDHAAHVARRSGAIAIFSCGRLPYSAARCNKQD